MPTTTHYKDMYVDAVLELAGSQKRSLLKEVCGFTRKKGAVVYLDAVEPADDATVTALSTLTDREDFENIASPVLADFLKLLTPFTAISKQRTLCIPKEIKAGHQWSTEQEVLEDADPKSATMNMLMSRIWKAQDSLVIGALAAASVNRGQREGDTVAVPFPADQAFSCGPQATGSGEQTSFNKEVINHVKSIFENNWVDSERIFMVISPDRKEELINQSGDKLQNRDFVSKEGLFERGELPDIYGVHIIVHPALTTASDADEPMYAFTENGVVWNESSPLSVDLAVSPTLDFNWVLKLLEMGNAVRVDDRRVVQVTYDRTV